MTTKLSAATCSQCAMSVLAGTALRKAATSHSTDTEGPFPYGSTFSQVIAVVDDCISHSYRH